MKVTKIVREFVEEEVNKKYPLPELDRIAMEQLDNAINDTMELIEKEANEFIFNRIKESGLQINEKIVGIKVYDWKYIYENNHSYYSSSIINPLRAVYEEASNKVKTKRQKAIKDILVNLELGGTKKELMEMLDNLPD